MFLNIASSERQSSSIQSIEKLLALSCLNKILIGIRTKRPLLCLLFIFTQETLYLQTYLYRINFILLFFVNLVLHKFRLLNEFEIVCWYLSGISAVTSTHNDFSFDSAWIESFIVDEHKHKSWQYLLEQYGDDITEYD